MPFYHDNDVKLLLLNDKGEITYSEKSIGKYVIRHSGDLYSIVSSDGVEKVNFSLVSVEFFSDIEFGVDTFKTINGNVFSSYIFCRII